jgi:WD40 repeat protein
LAVSIVVVCDCGKRLRVADEMKGKKIRCPGCKTVLFAEDSTAPVSPPPAITTKAKPATRSASNSSVQTPADVDASKPKKSKAKIFLLVGCGCLGLAGSGIAAVVLIIIIAVASHKGPEEKLLGQWVLDKEATQKTEPHVVKIYKDIRFDFKKEGACTIQLNDKVSQETWEFLKEKEGELAARQGKIAIKLTVSGQANPSVVWIEFKDDQHIEVSYPSTCRLRRPGASEDTSGPAAPSVVRDDKAPRLLAGHKKMITALRFSPDGQKLASASLDGTARIWEVSSGSTKQTLQNLPGDARGLVFLPDGKTVVTGSGSFAAGGAAKSWDADSGQMKTTLRTQKNFVSALARSADGKFLAWDDGTWVILWDVAAASVRTIFKDLAGSVRALAFSRDSKRLAVCDSSGNVRIWNLEAPALPPVTTNHKEPSCLAWAPSGDLAIGSEAKLLTLWILASKTVRRVIPGFAGEVRAVVFSPDGKVMAVSSRDTLKCFDATDFRELVSWQSTFRRDSQLGYLTFSADSKKLAVGSAESDSGGIILLDVEALLQGKP